LSAIRSTQLHKSRAAETGGRAAGTPPTGSVARKHLPLVRLPNSTHPLPESALRTRGFRQRFPAVCISDAGSLGIGPPPPPPPVPTRIQTRSDVSNAQRAAASACIKHLSASHFRGGPSRNQWPLFRGKRNRLWWRSTRILILRFSAKVRLRRALTRNGAPPTLPTRSCCAG